MNLTIETLLGDYVWVLGIGILFTLTIVFTFLVKGNEKTFLGLLLFFSGFVAWAGLIPQWVLYIIFILFLIMVGFEINSRRKK